MKKLTLTAAIVITFAAAASAQLRTVTDYFLAMPNDVYSTDASGTKLTTKAAITKYRRSLIKIEDIKNGFIRLEGSWEGWADIALFKKKDGSYLVAHAETGCGPACSGFVKFYTVNAGIWTDVTGSVFKELTDVDAAKAFNRRKSEEDETASVDDFNFYYILPREGRTIKAACNQCTESDDLTIAEWDFDGAKFTRK
ncbi:MAG: hypothetical protein JNL64_12285 [Blastocatellia bacterium]|jgi:hypothetical protein|nr:hypothetical protein [Blastocatellia bacterium]